MTLYELHQLTTELLKVKSGESKVLVSSDEEGNRIRDLADWSINYAVKEVYYELLADEDAAEYENTEQVVVLWP